MVLVSVVLILQLASLATMGVTLHESELRSDEIAALSAKVEKTALTISADVDAQIRLDLPTVGPISSVKPSNKSRPHVIMAMDIDYPPYAYTRKPPYENRQALDEVVGVGADMIKALGEHCDFDVTITQAHWNDCWGAAEIGAGLREGWYHGCMTFTHAAGMRNRFLDFTHSWATPNKPAGLITRLVNGVPHINGQDDLAGRTIVDVRPPTRTYHSPRARPARPPRSERPLPAARCRRDPLTLKRVSLSVCSSAAPLSLSPGHRLGADGGHAPLCAERVQKRDVQQHV